jgi:acyl-CoA reductase-like NAD-dependent aldehyde dehydrogenase
MAARAPHWSSTGCGQDRLYGIHRGRPRHPHRDGGHGKKISLELGGKSPFIVFEDADLDSVVEGVVDAIWFNQGQVCCAGSRILVQEGIAERLTEKLRARMETLRVGDPLDKTVDIGAIVAPVQLERITELVRQGQEEGATLWQPSWSCPQEGCFYPPTLFTDVSPASNVAQEEIFGPVWFCSPSARTRKRWSSQTTPGTAWPPPSGRRT